MGKMEYTVLDSKRKLKKVKEFSIECNGHTIKAQHSVNYLGQDLDNLFDR